jgi:hypothetical protein
MIALPGTFKVVCHVCVWRRKRTKKTYIFVKDKNLIDISGGLTPHAKPYVP